MRDISTPLLDDLVEFVMGELNDLIFQNFNFIGIEIKYTTVG